MFFDRSELLFAALAGAFVLLLMGLAAVCDHFKSPAEQCHDACYPRGVVSVSASACICAPPEVR